MTRPLPRQDQFCSSAPDRIAIHTDRGETWRDQTAHFEIAEADDRDRLLRRRAVTQHTGLPQPGHETDGMRIVRGKHRIDTGQFCKRDDTAGGVTVQDKPPRRFGAKRLRRIVEAVPAPGGARIVAATVVVSTLGCNAAAVIAMSPNTPWKRRSTRS